ARCAKPCTTRTRRRGRQCLATDARPPFRRAWLEPGRAWHDEQAPQEQGESPQDRARCRACPSVCFAVFPDSNNNPARKWPEVFVGSLSRRCARRQTGFGSRATTLRTERAAARRRQLLSRRAGGACRPPYAPRNATPQWAARSHVRHRRGRWG
ncbi:unnamed protein product, partial [Amoebophrya sp. A120]